ncbi:MAG TPA: hypothetical protein VFC82_09160 [Actinomycetaceae bacterium]|nr:hypothetical protein [Actinomycetaceae bacterium]
MRKLMLLSGPSCVGKGPLLKALKQFCPDIQSREIPVIRSHESRNGKPRANEVRIWDNPHYFMPAAEILKLSRKDYFVGDCRGLPQAIDTRKMADTKEDVVLLEVYHAFGADFREWAVANLPSLPFRTVFVTPFSEEEITWLSMAGVAATDYVRDVMIEKQLLRARFMGRTSLAAAEIGDIRNRAADAFSEMQSARFYTDVIVNHDGEGHSNWHMEPDGSFASEPEGDAGRTLQKLYEIVR